MSRCALVALSLLACGGKDDPTTVETGTTTTTTPAAPVVDGLIPDHGPVGTVVTLDGTAFGEEPGGSTVTVDGVPADVVSWSDEAIAVSVPDVLPGERPVVVTVAGTSSLPVPFRVTLPPRVYVTLGTDGDEDRLAAFEVAPGGALTPLGGAPFSLGQKGDFFFGGVPGNLALDEGRRRLFVSGTTDIAAFDLDPVTGAPTFAARTSAAAAQYIFGIAVTPDGAHLYASRCDEGDLVHYLVGADGGLTAAPESPAPVGDCGDQLLVTPDGAHLYVGLGNEVGAFSIGAGGALTEVAGGAASLASFSYGHGLSPDGSRLYAASYDGGGVYGFDVEATGALTPLAGSPFAAGAPGGAPNGVVISPNGLFAYVSLWDGAGVAVMDVGAGGALTDRSSVPTVVEPAPIAMSQDGTLLFVAGQEGAALEVFSVDGGGDLTSAGPPALFDATDYPQGVVVTGI